MSNPNTDTIAPALYDFQQDAVDAVAAEFKAVSSTLVVAPTGCGKTQIGAAVVAATRPRIMWIAHREELIYQAYERLEEFCPSRSVGIEMADQKTSDSIHSAADIVVATFQTLMSGTRLDKFRPGQFGLLVIDECHRSVAASYRTIAEHFLQDPDCKLLGLTATPNRTDEAALGEVFKSVAFSWDYHEARDAGWLVPVRTKSVVIESLDLSEVAQRGGDYVESQLIHAMAKRDKTLYECALAIKTLPPAKTLIFCSGVDHAIALSDILRQDGMPAEVIHGRTPRDERHEILDQFEKNAVGYLANCAVLTEGYDCPSIERIVMARPTTSDLLYRQMLGRGCRVLPGVLSGLEHGNSEDRINAIAASAKTHIEIIDLVPCQAVAKPITAITALAGNTLDEVAARAEEIARNSEVAMEVDEALHAAEVILAQERAIRSSELAQRTRQAIAFGGRVRFRTMEDYFDILEVPDRREPGWFRGKRATHSQVAMLNKNKISHDPTTLTRHQANQIIGRIIARSQQDLATPKQMYWIEQKNAVPEGRDIRTITFPEASDILDRVFGDK